MRASNYFHFNMVYHTSHPMIQTSFMANSDNVSSYSEQIGIGIVPETGQLLGWFDSGNGWNFNNPTIAAICVKYHDYDYD